VPVQAAAESPPPSARVPYRVPFDWPSFLGFLAPRLVAGVETIEDDCFYRVIEIDGKAAVLKVGPDGQDGFLPVSLYGAGPDGLPEAVKLTSRFFDLDAPVDEIGGALSADPLLAPLVEAMPGIRVPGAWTGFEIAVRAILGQQISVRAATTLAGRVAARYGTPVRIASPVGRRLNRLFPGPRRLARAHFNDMGIVGARIETLRRLSSAVAKGEVGFDTAAEPDDVVEQLCRLKGIGKWTGEYIAMRALRNPDAFPESDLGLLNALYPDRRATPRELADHAGAWRPWRAYAALLIWNRGEVSGG